jgi:glucose uptake protein GlcU
MTSHFTWKYQRKLVLTLVAGVVLITGAGCQTCRLSEEDFEKQQRGETVDKETGKAVATVGTLGYYGYMLGECLSAAFRK